MALEIVDVSHAYQGNAALQNVSLRAEAGEVTCLLGASGCGKTTALRLIAGLLPVQSGKILLDGDILADGSSSPPPEQRDVGLVFQEGALFPHMTVAQNIAFGLPKSAPRDVIARELLAQIGLEGFGPRYPHTLSGGQQQRVALARALAPSPKVILLDEPFANIDIIRRRTLRFDMTQLLAQRGCVSILVTHDPEEAIEIADRIVVMSAGQVIGAGSPSDLYDRPPNKEVGRLIGGGSVLRAHVTNNGLDTPFGHWPLTCLASGLPETKTMDLLVRREAAGLEMDPDGAEVVSVRCMGPTNTVTVITQDLERFSVNVDRRDKWASGDRVAIIPASGQIHAFAI